MSALTLLRPMEYSIKFDAITTIEDVFSFFVISLISGEMF